MEPTTDDLPRHAAQKQFPVQDDCLQLGGARETVSVVGPLCTPLEVLV